MIFKKDSIIKRPINNPLNKVYDVKLDYFFN